jgi:3-oxoacyl-[acyl-carrier protein] reductase
LLDKHYLFKIVKKGYPLGRLGQPVEVANLCVFLMSDLASNITGGSFSVDGGRSAL